MVGGLIISGQDPENAEDDILLRKNSWAYKFVTLNGILDLETYLCGNAWLSALGLIVIPILAILAIIVAAVFGIILFVLIGDNPARYIIAVADWKWPGLKPAKIGHCPISPALFVLLGAAIWWVCHFPFAVVGKILGTILWLIICYGSFIFCMTIEPKLRKPINQLIPPSKKSKQNKVKRYEKLVLEETRRAKRQLLIYTVVTAALIIGSTILVKYLYNDKFVNDFWHSMLPAICILLLIAIFSLPKRLDNLDNEKRIRITNSRSQGPAPSAWTQNISPKISEAKKAAGIPFRLLTTIVKAAHHQVCPKVRIKN